MMPDEAGPHRRTWMAFKADNDIWARKQIPEVKRNLANIARTIAKYEPVNILVSRNDEQELISLLGGLKSHLHLIELVNFEVNDFWLRDTGPVFVVNEEDEKFGIDFNFNGWGRKQVHHLDSKVASLISAYSDSEIIQTDLVLEGGGIEVDGQGTAIISKSCVLNDNRNPGKNQREVEEELKSLLGLRKIIWLEGIKGRDITDGHTDFYARFASPGVVLVGRDNYKPSYDYDITRENIRVLDSAHDANGNKLELFVMDAPDTINESYGVNDFAAGYIGYYVCNGAVIAQKFGDQSTDQKAFEILSKVYPNRMIEQIQIDGIASGGGSVHCTTQQEI